jgi:hypothetical protein
MTCPHFFEEHRSMSALCLGVAVQFEPSVVDQLNFCRTVGHRHCPLYRNAVDDLSLEIHQEVARAIG